MVNIVVVDDDAHIRELIAYYMRQEGFDVVEAEDGKEALATIKSAGADLVILDVMMPEMDGWDLCRELRAGYPDLPLLMLTAKGETNQKVKGFELGADDYLVKPFDPPELIVRVKALLKRYRIESSQKLSIGSYELDRGRLEVTGRGESQTLPLKEFELLFCLASYPGQIFTRNQLIEKIWGIDYEGDDRTVDVHIKRLRERFPEASSPFAIVTIRGLGYRIEVKA
ncbi:response regulator transcription factor [Paenibacillus thalictri]|uniref:Heme response regulator HssR n=1 Tax=Paenibacillus thalictri TaxID=2527873 RepID=A0A4Q9DFL4_9BACL|nr:response regulator transcription factor [Paenibacillus thalictri]TBL70780.1 response regulator transcription factor [Paenibacillus thalictri]